VLVCGIEPAPVALDEQRTGPHRSRNCDTVAERILIGVVGQHCGIRTELRELETVERIGVDDAALCSNARDNSRLPGNSARMNLDMIIAEKCVEKIPVAIFPRFP